MKEASFVVMYMIHGERGYDTELVMIRQMRDGRRTLECAGGRVDEGENALEGAVREVYEETGIRVPAHRLIEVDSKFKHPSSDSLSYCFSCELHPEELEEIRQKAQRGNPNGVDGEEIYLTVVRLNSILNGDTEIDWATLGMVLNVLTIEAHDG
jgi:8-oxo-dGTP pyrophosphatase MutT (NUDIX family)